MTVIGAIRRSIGRKKEGAIVSAKALEGIAGRAVIDQSLSRLEKAGELMRVSRGMYVVPVRGKFGSYTPSPEKVVRSYAKAKGQAVVPHGAIAANRFGLTTQQPVRQVYVTAGQPGRIALGSNPVEVRHVPEWQIIYPGHPAGEAVRALAYMGKTGAKENAIRIRKALGQSEWAKIKRAKSKLPGWLAEAVSEAERVA